MPNLLWVSDITPRCAPLYSPCSWICLFEWTPRGLVTDAYSRKIVGWALEDSLGAIGPIAALKMAIIEYKSHLHTNLIHHCAGSPV
jgi:putative transposase